MPSLSISGYCAPGFEPVREALHQNFGDGFEIGCCTALVVEGRTVVDLWAGTRDPHSGAPWTQDTVVNMMSVTKSIGAICLLMLVDRGSLELDAPIARYWPAFGANGKASITVRHAMAQLAGLPFLDALEEGDLWDEERVAAAFESQTPEWPVGARPCYHSFTLGLLYQQIVRRVDGRSLGNFLHDELYKGFGIDYHVGLDEAVDARRATYVQTPGTPSWDGILGRAPSPLNRAWRSLERTEDANSARWRFGEMASANGHGTARSVARLYGALAVGGELEGRQVLSRATVDDARAQQWYGPEAGTNRVFGFGTGFMRSCEPFPFGGRPDNFGHPGVGGAVAFADPHARLGFCYAPNHMAPVADAGPYATRLIQAVYRCVDA